MDLSEVVIFLDKDWDKYQTKFKLALESDVSFLSEINQVIISNLGKQLRPILLLLAARLSSQGEMLGEQVAGTSLREQTSGSALREQTYNYAAAVEIIHNATLLHDDVADNSTHRRGMATVFSQFGAAPAVLLGDYWLAKSVSLIMENNDLDTRVMASFSKTISDLAEGELLQLEKSETLDTKKEDYYKIIYGKTASLFETALVSGAYSVDAQDSYVSALKDYATSIGYAFQIRDDIFDYTPSAKIGKNVGVDILEKKITLPFIGALLNSEGNNDEYLDKVRNIDNYPEYKEQILNFVIENNGLEYAQEQLNLHIDKAIASLSIFPDKKEKEYLIALARFVGNRQI